MSTFGETGVGTTYLDLDPNSKYASRFQKTGVGPITSFSVHCGALAAGAAVFRVGVYADSGGAAGALLGIATAISVPAGSARASRTLVPVGSFASAAGYYWLCVQTADNNLLLSMSPTGGTSQEKVDTYSDGLSNPFGGSGSGTREFCIAADHYSVPTAPTIGASARVTDTQATIAWTNNPTTDGSYSSLAVERQTDGGSWVQIASPAVTVTSYTDNTVMANHTYAYRIKATNPAGSGTSASSAVIYTTPAAPTGLVAVKTGASTATLTWEDVSNSEEYFEVSRTNDAGENWTVLSATIAAGVETYDDASVPGGTVAYRLRALRGALASDYSANSNNLTTLTPPAAPTLTPAWGTYSPTGATLRVSWQHNSLDGSIQDAADVVVTIDGAETTYNITDDTAHYDIDISGAVATNVVTAKVRTKGLHATPGDYSAVASTTLADSPAIVITTPATDAAEVVDAPLVVEWTYTDEFAQASWILQLYRSGVLAKTWTGTTEVSQSIPITDLADDSSFSLTLTVRSGSGIETVVVRTFTTDYLGPELPTVTAAFSRTTLSVEVVAYTAAYERPAVRAIGASEDLTAIDWLWLTWVQDPLLPATDHLTLLRIETFDGVEETTVLSDPLEEGSSFVDYLPRLDIDVTYRVMAVAANGAYSVTDQVVATKSRGAVAVNFGAGDVQILTLRWNGKRGHDSEDDSEAFVFAGRGLPVVYTGEHTSESINAGAVVFDDATLTAMRALRVWRRVCTYREPYGYRAHVKTGRIANAPGQIAGSNEISVDMTVVE